MMNKNQTVEKLNQMRIYAMAQMYQLHLKNNQHNDTTPDEYLSLLVDHEWEQRQNNRIQRLISMAGFRQNASIQEVDLASSRNLEKNLFNRLSNLDFVNKKENLIITGPSGVGKSYLIQALGHQACLLGMNVQYHLAARLFNKLKLAKLDGTYDRELKKLGRTDVLILDDFGLQAFDNHAREALLDIIQDRFNHKSTFLSSQIPVSAWYDIIGEDTIADAILDRIVNSSHRIDLKGESMRKNFMQ